MPIIKDVQCVSALNQPSSFPTVPKDLETCRLPLQYLLADSFIFVLAFVSISFNSCMTYIRRLQSYQYLFF